MVVDRGWGNISCFEPGDLIDWVDQIACCRLRWQIDGGWWQACGDNGFFEYTVESVVKILSWEWVPNLFGVINVEWNDIFIRPKFEGVEAKVFGYRGKWATCI